MFTLTAQAQTTSCKIFVGTGCTSFSDLIGAFVLPTMQAIVIGVAIIYLLMGAIQYITSAGDEKAAKVAQTTLTNAAIGLAIALLVVMIMQVLKSVLVGSATGDTQKLPDNLIPSAKGGTSTSTKP